MAIGEGPEWEEGSGQIVYSGWKDVILWLWDVMVIGSAEGEGSIVRKAVMEVVARSVMLGVVEVEVETLARGKIWSHWGRSGRGGSLLCGTTEANREKKRKSEEIAMK